MINLRPYQVDALAAVEQAGKEGVRRPLIVHPTGTGKGVVMGALAKQRAERGRSLVLTHRKEIADQFIKNLAWQAPELTTGIVKAEVNEVGAPVVVASVDTVRRDDRLRELIASQDAYGPFTTIIADEAHHAPAPSWTKVMQAMGSFNPYGPLTVGFTATPERDGKTLGVWEKVVSYMSIREAIYQGFLVPILPALIIQTAMDMKKVRKTRGDFSDRDLGREIEESGAIAQMADAVVQHAADRKGIAFLPTVRTSQMLADALSARGISSEHLDGATPADERKAILERLKTGATRVVTNCAVLTEGFDEPSIEFVMVGRPTVFHGLYVQMIGRGTRLYPGKKNLLIIDIVGASERHDVITRVDLGLELDDERRKPAEPGEKLACKVCEVPCDVEEHRCALCHRYLPVKKILKDETRHDNCRSGNAGAVDVFGASRLRWLPVEDSWCLGAGEEIVLMVPAGPDIWKLAAYESGRVKVLHDQIPAQWAMGIGEDRAKAFMKLVERDARWLRQPISDLQKSRLLREGLPEKVLPRVRTRGDAADLLTRIGGRRAIRKLTRR